MHPFICIPMDIMLFYLLQCNTVQCHVMLCKLMYGRVRDHMASPGIILYLSCLVLYCIVMYCTELNCIHLQMCMYIHMNAYVYKCNVHV